MRITPQGPASDAQWNHHIGKVTWSGQGKEGHWGSPTYPKLVPCARHMASSLVKSCGDAIMVTFVVRMKMTLEFQEVLKLPEGCRILGVTFLRVPFPAPNLFHHSFWEQDGPHFSTPQTLRVSFPRDPWHGLETSRCPSRAHLPTVLEL